ncbi:MAG: hypothetical protein HRT88_14275, partial [Lentisphaeraceae bacterium]|nr:hypothetical protein [Lentisphaeraceae bacterium]
MIFTISIAIACFMVFYFPPAAKALGSKILTEDADVITRIVAGKLGGDLEARKLNIELTGEADNDEVVNTISLLKNEGSSQKNIISEVIVYDAEGIFISSLSSILENEKSQDAKESASEDSENDEEGVSLQHVGENDAELKSLEKTGVKPTEDELFITTLLKNSEGETAGYLKLTFQKTILNEQAAAFKNSALIAGIICLVVACGLGP